MEMSIREELHKLIDEADDERLSEIYDWLAEGVPESIKYTPEELETFYERLKEYEDGKCELYTPEQSFALIRRNNS